MYALFQTFKIFISRLNSLLDIIPYIFLISHFGDDRNGLGMQMNAARVIIIAVIRVLPQNCPTLSYTAVWIMNRTVAVYTRVLYLPHI